MKPIIGIVGHPYINKDNNLIFQTSNSLVRKISEHGGLPIIICPTQTEKFQNKKLSEIKPLTFFEKNDLDDVLKICDGIIKAGGTRIYEYERYIYNYVYENDIPYLGICAGMQMMAGYNSDCKNVRNNTEINHFSNEKYVHKLQILKDTLLYSILNKEEISVNSIHNYHIDSPGINSINAYSEDGLIEGIENLNKKFHLGLQWHPEGLDDMNSDRLFDEFIYQSKKCKQKIKI